MNYSFWILVFVSLFTLLWNYFQHRSIEVLKRENEKDNLIHRIQFEKEFEIYSDLWSKLVDLRNATISLRPEFDSFESNKSIDEIYLERFEKLNERYLACVSLFDKNKPFYSPEVYNEVEKAIRLARREAYEFKHVDSNKKEYWEQAEKNIQDLTKSIDITCELIRKRIGMLRVSK